MKKLIEIISEMSEMEESVLIEAQNYEKIFNPLWTMANKVINEIAQRFTRKSASN